MGARTLFTPSLNTPRPVEGDTHSDVTPEMNVFRWLSRKIHWCIFVTLCPGQKASPNFIIAHTVVFSYKMWGNDVRSLQSSPPSPNGNVVRTVARKRCEKRIRNGKPYVSRVSTRLFFKRYFMFCPYGLFVFVKPMDQT